MPDTITQLEARKRLVQWMGLALDDFDWTDWESASPVFNPFKYVSDDHKCLIEARTRTSFDERNDFFDFLKGDEVADYRIGDWTNALCAVLWNVEVEE